jgi:hypothetical protein
MLDTYDGLRELAFIFGAVAIICFLWLAMDSE